MQAIQCRHPNTGDTHMIPYGFKKNDGGVCAHGCCGGKNCAAKYASAAARPSVKRHATARGRARARAENRRLAAAEE